MRFDKMKQAALAATLAVAAWAPTAGATPFPGPDAFGYSGASIAFNLRDASAGTLAFGAATVDDAVTGAIGIGFGFSFYGVTYTDAYIGSNGFITFSAGQSQGCCNGGPLPGTTDPSNMVAGWFTDLVSNNTAGGSFGVPGEIRYMTVGSVGSREFIVEWINNPYFRTGTTNTFEVILHEGTNDIELQYDHTTSDFHTRSVGIENLGGTIGLQRLFDSTSLLNAEGICISTGSTTCPANVPEPGSMALLGLGLLGFGWSRRRKA